MSTAYIWRKHGYHLSPLADPAYVLSGKNGLQTTYAKQTRAELFAFTGVGRLYK